MATATPKDIGLTLVQRAAKWRHAMANADTGPLVIAAEIVELSETWDSYKEQAEGKTINEWLQRTFGDGRTLSFWIRRDEAVEALGEASRRTMNHEVAVWLHGRVPTDRLEEAKLAIMRGRKENGDNCLTLAQARPIIDKLLGAQPKQRVCAKCAEKDERIANLEAAMRAAGLTPPE